MAVKNCRPLFWPYTPNEKLWKIYKEEHSEANHQLFLRIFNKYMLDFEDFVLIVEVQDNTFLKLLKHE